MHQKFLNILLVKGSPLSQRLYKLYKLYSNFTALRATCAPAFIMFKSGGDKQKQSYNNYKGKSLF